MSDKDQLKIDMLMAITKNSYRLTREQALTLLNVARAPYITRNNIEFDVLVQYGLLQSDGYDMLSTTEHGDDILLEAADKLGYKGSTNGANEIEELKERLNNKNIEFTIVSKRRNTIFRLAKYHKNAFKNIEFRQDDILLSAHRNLCTNKEIFTGYLSHVVTHVPMLSTNLCYSVSYENFNDFMDLVF